MMKKYACRVLAAAMAVSMMVPGVNVLAASIDSGLSEGTNSGIKNSAETTVNYTVQDSYTWTVPTEITFDANAGINKKPTKDGSVSVTKNIIKYGKNLKISIDKDEDFKIHTTEGAELTYDVKKKDGDVLAKGAEILSVAAGTNEKTQELTYTLSTASSGAEVAGTYTGTLNYVATVE